MKRWVPAALLFYTVLAAVAWGWRVGLRGEPLLYADADAALRGPRLLDAFAGAAAAALLVAASRLLTRGSAAGRALAVELARVLGDLRTSQVLALAVASGVGEELFFRGALQPRVGLGLASVLFGLAHLLPRWPLVLWSLFAGVAGLLFGGLYQATGSLLAPVVAHVLVNALNLRWLVERYAPGARRN